MLHSRRAAVTAAAFSLLPAALRPRHPEPRIVVVNDNGEELFGAEFNTYPRGYRWQRRTIEVVTVAPAERDTEIAAGVEAIDWDADKITMPFRAGVRKSCNQVEWREGQIIVCESLGLGYYGEAAFWVRDRDPETIIAGRVWMGLVPRFANDAKYQQIVSHEVLHTLGAAHKDDVFPDGHPWGGWPVSVMHSGLFTYQAEIENVNALLDSDRQGLIRLNYRYDGSGVAASRKRRKRKRR